MTGFVKSFEKGQSHISCLLCISVYRREVACICPLSLESILYCFGHSLFSDVCGDGALCHVVLCTTENLASTACTYIV